MELVNHAFPGKRAAAVLTAALGFALAVGAAQGVGSKIFNPQTLVSDGAFTAVATDTSLVNAWGLSAGPTTPWWVSNNGSSTSTLYNGAGTKSALVVTVPGSPTGTVFNGSTTDFPISANGVTAAS